MKYDFLRKKNFELGVRLNKRTYMKDASEEFDWHQIYS